MSVNDHAESFDLPDYDEIEPNLPWAVSSTEPATAVSDALRIASPSNVNNVKAAVPYYERVVQPQTLQSEVFTETCEAQQTVREARQESATVIDLTTSGEEYGETGFENDAKYTQQLHMDDSGAYNSYEKSGDHASAEFFDIRPGQTGLTAGTLSDAIPASNRSKSNIVRPTKEYQEYSEWTKLLDHSKECRLGRCYSFGACSYCQARNGTGTVKTKYFRLSSRVMPSVLEGPLKMRMRILKDYSGAKVKFLDCRTNPTAEITGTVAQIQLAIDALIAIGNEFSKPLDRYIMMTFKGNAFYDAYLKKVGELSRYMDIKKLHEFESLHLTLGRAVTDISPDGFYEYFKTTVLPELKALIAEEKRPINFYTAKNGRGVLFPEPSDFFFRIKHLLESFAVLEREKLYRPHMSFKSLKFSDTKHVHLHRIIPGLVFENLEPDAIHISRSIRRCFDSDSKKRERLTECWFML